MDKKEFKSKLKELRKPNESVGELHKRIAKMTGFSTRTVSRAKAGEASKRFYQVFELILTNNKIK